MTAIQLRAWVMRHSAMSTPSKLYVNVRVLRRGADIADPEQSVGRYRQLMRHLKLRPERDVDGMALMKLIETAYRDMKLRVSAEDMASRHAEPVR